jgi:protein gp37
MATKTGIEWTDRTWNPWHGCTHVSAGCDNCYMFTEKRRYGQDPEQVVRSKTTFNAPLKWGAEPARVFTCSWSDWFHVDADPWRDEAWDIIRRTPHLTYQILTKRTGRIARHLPADWGDGYPNVWLGTSVESQDQVFRARQLSAVPAAQRFLSCEPLIGAVDLRDALNGIAWVIVGGESGPNHRMMKPEWARAIRDACATSGVAFFFKQWGGPRGHKRGGEDALLDGVRHVHFPAEGS